MVSKENIINYLDEGLLSYKLDPADTDFQRGYEACLEEIKAWIESHDQR